MQQELLVISTWLAQLTGAKQKLHEGMLKVLCHAIPKDDKRTALSAVLGSCSVLNLKSEVLQSSVPTCMTFWLRWMLL